MKLRPLAVWLLLLIGGGVVCVEAVESATRNYAAEMSVNADVQADFFKKYPDLRDEGDVVAQAARALAEEGRETQDEKAAAELLANRTRALLARRTPQEWQRKAINLFPELGVAGSEFNALFVRYFKELQQTSPQFMEEPSWPVLLARRCADELRPKSPRTAASAQPKGNTPATNSSSSTSAQPGQRSAWWVSSLSFILLLAILVQPARWLWRCRRAFAGSGGPVTLWQRALGPAAWTYLGVALIALVRTFVANADQRFMDRFGITLLVSLAAGAVFALPAYGIALGGMWWWRRRTLAAPKSADRELPGTAAIPAGGRKH